MPKCGFSLTQIPRIRSESEKNMPDYEFSLTPIFLYKERIKDSVLIRENTGQ